MVSRREYILLAVIWGGMYALMGATCVSGCVSARPQAQGDVSAIKAELEAKTKVVAELQAKVAMLDKSVSQGANSKYSSGAGWVALVASVNSLVILLLIAQHWRSSRHRHRLEGLVAGQAGKGR